MCSLFFCKCPGQEGVTGIQFETGFTSEIFWQAGTGRKQSDEPAERDPKTPTLGDWKGQHFGLGAKRDKIIGKESSATSLWQYACLNGEYI